MNKPAPLLSKLPQCIKCQSVAWPLWAEYWHMGATTARLAKVNGPLGAVKVNSEKRWLKWAPGNAGQDVSLYRNEAKV
jgi:hypothetical protein